MRIDLRVDSGYDHSVPRATGLRRAKIGCFIDLPMKMSNPTICRMSPRQRKSLDPAKLNERFGAHFQGLIDAAGLTVKELRMRLAQKDHEFSEAAIRHWMRGERYPMPEVMLSLAQIFGLSDYRHVLPPSKQKPRK